MKRELEVKCKDCHSEMPLVDFFDEVKAYHCQECIFQRVREDTGIQENCLMNIDTGALSWKEPKEKT